MTKAILSQPLPDHSAFHPLGDPTEALAHVFAGAINSLMQHEAGNLIGVEKYERDPEHRQAYRNGTRSRRFDTRMGTLDLQVPRIRGQAYTPSFLTYRERCETALMTLVYEAYVGGLSTRKIEKLVSSMGIDSLSKSQVSEFNKRLDEFVAAFRERPLTGKYPYLMVDAVYEKIRFQGRSKSHAVVIAYGVNDEGMRELIGVEIVDTESYESWSEFFRKLLARGLNGVKLVISDAHAGLKKAIAEIFLGSVWQRCKVHFQRNILAAVSKSAKEAVGADLKPLFHQKTYKAAMTIVDELVEKYGEKHPRAMQILLDGIDDALSYLDFPSEHATKISSTNPIERVNREIRRRTKVVGVFPSIESAIRLIGMILLEQTEEWESQRGYMSVESMKQIELMTSS